MMCQRSGLAPISIIGFGFAAVSSLSRVPRPPARITAFMPLRSARALLYRPEQWLRLIRDLASDRERRCRGRRGRVADVQRPAGDSEDEVVDEAAVAAESPRTSSRRSARSRR